MTTPDETEPQSRLKAAPPDQREADGPEDLLKATQEEQDIRRESLREAEEAAERTGEVPD
jgi:hypothetical protein